jgi:hypothetical protein
MKNIFSITMIAAFIFAFGTTYAGELYNGVSDFTGRTRDTFEIAQGMNEVNAVEGAAGGGMRGNGSEKLYNGITDFSGASYDTFVIGTGPGEMKNRESSAGGGLRMVTMDKKADNGVTDFSGRSFDTPERDQ